MTHARREAVGVPHEAAEVVVDHGEGVDPEPDPRQAPPVSQPAAGAGSDASGTSSANVVPCVPMPTRTDPASFVRTRPSLDRTASVVAALQKSAPVVETNADAGEAPAGTLDRLWSYSCAHVYDPDIRAGPSYTLTRARTDMVAQAGAQHHVDGLEQGERRRAGRRVRPGGFLDDVDGVGEAVRRQPGHDRRLDAQEPGLPQSDLQVAGRRHEPRLQPGQPAVARR